MKLYHIKIACFKIDEMREFYLDELKLKLIFSDSNSFTCQAGRTKITFVKSEDKTFYHLCLRTDGNYFTTIFNILNEQNRLLSNENEEISMFWKGKQCYFYDPDGNILEILERNVPVENEWYDICEIGIPSENVESLKKDFSFLNTEYNNENDSFSFFGDQEGVFVLVKQGRNWYPTERAATIHPITLYVSGEEAKTYLHPSLPYTIHVKKEWSPELPAVQFWVARPTDKLEEIIEFYEKGIGLKKVGGFSHNGYDGVMFGLPGKDYHLEFTHSFEGSPCPVQTKDKLLVFYIPDITERNNIVRRLNNMGFYEKESENPY